jgi:hypothetical protein
MQRASSAGKWVPAACAATFLHMHERCASQFGMPCRPKLQHLQS